MLIPRLLLWIGRRGKRSRLSSCAPAIVDRQLFCKIEQALARIDYGTYGYREETGDPIGLGRLLARPTATLSLEAPERREQKQRVYGK